MRRLLPACALTLLLAALPAAGQQDFSAPLTDRINAAIAQVSRQPVKFILNTHWHFDHTGGNENCGTAGAIIFAHENVRKRMGTEQLIAFIILNGMYPFIDTSSGGSIEGTIAACDRGLALADVAGRIKRMISDGRSVEQIVAAKVTADYDAKYGGGFIKGDKLVEMIAGKK